MGLAGAALLVVGVQVALPAPAEAMIRQETQEECEAAGGWWEWHFGACITFDDDSGGGSGGGDSGSGGGGSTGGDDSSGDGGSGGGGFGSGGDDPGSPDGSWDDSASDDDLKDPSGEAGCFELQTDGGAVYEVCQTGPPEGIDEGGEDEDGVWHPDSDRPRGPTIAMQGNRRGPHGRAAARRARQARQAAKVRASHR